MSTDIPKPHITELLDLTAVLETATRVTVGQALAKVDACSEESITKTIADMRVIDRQVLRQALLELIYPTARVIAEQAYNRALDSQRDENARLGNPVPLEVNPFAIDQVIT